MSKFWHVPMAETDPRKIEFEAIILRAHRLRSRYMARKLRQWGRALLALPAASLQALGRYSRAVAQPWRMNGNRVAHGNRR